MLVHCFRVSVIKLNSQNNKILSKSEMFISELIYLYIWKCK